MGVHAAFTNLLSDRLHPVENIVPTESGHHVCSRGTGWRVRLGLFCAIPSGMRNSFLRLVALVAISFTVACPGPSEPEGWVPAFDATESGWLLSVWGPTPDNLVAVGGTPDRTGIPGRGAIMGFDGAEWAPVNTGLAVPLLNWAFGFGEDEMFVVGNAGTILHFSGGAWTSEVVPTEENLWGVWGAAPDDVWVVGGSGRTESVATLLHYDGSEWTLVELEIERSSRAFFKVWGSGANDVVVVGQNGVLLRYDGVTWTEFGLGTNQDLIAVWGTGPDRIAVVGGRNNGVVATWNGAEWRMESLSPLLGLNGVWMRDDNVIHAVGIEGTLARIDFETLEYEEDFTDARTDFHAVFGDSSGRLTTVGGNFAFTAGPYEGIAYTRLLDADE